jgi:hypothetical protein
MVLGDRKKVRFDMAELTNEQAVKHYTEFMRRIQVGAYEERSSEHYLTDTWPEDGVEESVHNLESWALKQGLAFHWYKDDKVYRLEPMSDEELADYQHAQRLKEYKVALWPSALSASPVAEIDTVAENAIAAALSAMKTNGTSYMGVVIVMSSEQQEWFYDAARHTGNNTLAYSRTGTSPRFTDKPFIWKAGTDG